ncbi:Bacterial regulatory protein, Fis family [compost metagenome]
MQAQLKGEDGADFRHAVAMPGMASAQVDAPAVLEVHAEQPVALAPVSDIEPTPPTETLREHSRKLIEDTLAAHGGNVSQAARQLNVSRGTLYRRLRGWHDDDSSAAD